MTVASAPELNIGSLYISKLTILFGRQTSRLITLTLQILLMGVNCKGDLYVELPGSLRRAWPALRFHDRFLPSWYN